MAARKNRGVTELSDNWKEKIRAGAIMDRLLKYFDGQLELTPGQVNAAKIILAKTIPDLARSEVTGRDGGPIEHKDLTKTDAEILAQYVQQKGK